MSTAKTAIGCLAEDYPEEMALICMEWETWKREQLNRRQPAPATLGEERLLYVAHSFVHAVEVSR